MRILLALVGLFLCSNAYAQPEMTTLPILCDREPSTFLKVIVEDRGQELVMQKKDAGGETLVLYENLSNRDWTLARIFRTGAMCIIATSPERDPGT